MKDKKEKTCGNSVNAFICNTGNTFQCVVLPCSPLSTYLSQAPRRAAFSHYSRKTHFITAVYSVVFVDVSLSISLCLDVVLPEIERKNSSSAQRLGAEQRVRLKRILRINNSSTDAADCKLTYYVEGNVILDNRDPFPFSSAGRHRRVKFSPHR